MDKDIDLLGRIQKIIPTLSTDNVGDIYTRALDLLMQVTIEYNKLIGESYIAQIREFGRNAEIGWKLFDNPIKPSTQLDDEQQIQVLTIIVALHTFCYGVERLEEASIRTGPTSTPVRFYINSIYHYIADLYLLGKDKDPIGGIIYKTLDPIGLSALLNPVIEVIDRPLETGISFGETIKAISTDQFFHGTYWQEDICTILGTTECDGLRQTQKLNLLIWELFNRTFILKLHLMSVLTALGTKPNELIARYFSGAKLP